MGFAGRFLAAVVLSCVGAGSAHAALRTDFEVSRCSWEATHVVVANVVLDEVDKVEVVESWAGDLAVGTQIGIKRLHELRTEENRTVSTWHHGNEKPPRLVSAKRAILYLVGARSAEWRPAMKADDDQSSFQISLAWVEGEDVFAFQQIMNPGPLELTKVGTFADVKKETLRVLEGKAAFVKAVAAEKPEERASALEPLLSSDAWIVSWKAWEELEKLEGAALSVVRAILKDSARVAVHARAIAVLSRLGGVEVEAELTKIVESETAALREKKDFHEDVALAAVGRLYRFHTHDCEAAVVALRDLCATSNEKLALACDRVLQHLACSPKLRR